MARRGSSTFSSLQVPNYRRYFLAQIASMSGTWMQTVAMGWLVYEITGSPTQIGAVTGAQFLPTLLGSMHGGLIADRFDKRRTLMITQSALGLQAAVLAFLAFSGLASLEVLYVMAFLQGCVTAVDNPTRQSFVSEVVPPESLTNAVGLNAAAFNSARIIGPGIGGVIIDHFGAATCFAFKAVAMGVMISVLVRMRTADLYPSTRAPRGRGQMRQGLRYAWEEPTIRVVLAMVAVTGLLAMNFNVVLPVVAKEVFGGDASTYGTMTSAMGVGALIGALVMAARSRPNLRRQVGAAAGLGCGLGITALSPQLGVALVGLVFTGMAMTTFNSGSNAVVQLTSRPDMRGRVLSLMMLFNVGSTPIGGPLVGWVGERFGARWSLGIGSAACFASAVGATVALLARRRHRALPPSGQAGLSGAAASAGR